MGARVSLLRFRDGRHSLRRHRTAIRVSQIVHSLSLLIIPQAHGKLAESKRHLTAIPTNLDENSAVLREILGDFDF